MKASCYSGKNKFLGTLCICNARHLNVAKRAPAVFNPKLPDYKECAQTIWPMLCINRSKLRHYLVKHIARTEEWNMTIGGAEGGIVNFSGGSFNE